MPDILIKNADAIVTMNAGRDELAGADVLIRGGIIAAVGHDLQDARLAAHQPDTDQLEPQPLDHGADDVGKATVDGSFGDKVGHVGFRISRDGKQKSGHSGPLAWIVGVRFGPRLRC